MKVRILPESNYKSFYLDGKTIRIALDPNKPILELKYPEFFDVKVTSKCFGKCPYCYQSSLETCNNQLGIVDKFVDYFSKFDNNQKPYQIAFGGGEPTSHPEFCNLLQTCKNMGMTPNYTTNGMWVNNQNAFEILSTTIMVCGGVAVSTHPHLEKYWREAVNKYLERNVHTNLHVIIGNRNSIDKFSEIYNEYTGKIKYFVLLPMSPQGRSKESFNDWDYLKSKINGSPKDVAFGANFHPYLSKDNKFNVSIYDPESMSAYLDLESMKCYKSSFSNEEKRIG
jgi:organic radical activating enzyme